MDDSPTTPQDDGSYQVPSSTLPTAIQNPYSMSSGGILVDEMKVKYRCGDCNGPNALKRGDPIRCLECGHRVLYKERTTKLVQFEAR